jgi:putative membrane protein
MMGYGDGYGGLFMMILWTVFLILIAVFIYALIKGKTTGMWGSPVVETPVEILKKRYAKGEITKDQFEQMKKDIQT